MEERHLSTILSAQKKIKLEIQDLSERLKMNKELIQKYRDHLDEVEEDEEMEDRE